MSEMKLTLKALRVQYGLTQEKAAKLVGVSESTWHSYENAKTYPPIKVIDWITKVFGVSYDDIIFEPSIPIKL